MIKMKSLLVENITDTPEFKRWFGNSKIVDKNGNPLICYHSTHTKFTTFDTERNIRDDRVGSYFTPNTTSTDRYSGSGMTLLVYLKVETPLILKGEHLYDSFGITRDQRDKIIKQGYDGVIGGEGTDWHEIVVFDPKQIKSAYGNNGNFNSHNSDITKEYKI